MQRKTIAAAAFALFAFIGPANAQSNSPVLLPGGCGTGNATNNLTYLTVDSTLKLCVNAAVAVTGFPSVQTTGTPISVTTGGVTGTLPTGAVVVASNVGATNGAYCKLGASASTSDQLIPPNSWFAFTVGANTQLTCITSTSTTTVNMVGGSGLPTGSGGGGGGSGSSGAVFGPTAVGSANANPPVVIGGTATGAAGQNVQGLAIKPASTAAAATDQSAVTNESPNSQLSTAIGTTTDAVGSTPSTGSAASLIALAKAINNNVSSAIPAGTNLIGKVGIDQTTPGTTNGVQVNAALPTGTNTIGSFKQTDGTTVAVTDPCQGSAKSYLPITATTSLVKVIATGVSAKKIYICQIILNTTAANNVAVFEATTASTCATTPVAVYGAGTSVATAANGFPFPANGGVSLGGGGFSIAQTTVNNNDLCIGTSAATPLTGGIMYVTQ